MKHDASWVPPPSEANGTTPPATASSSTASGQPIIHPDHRSGVG
jgi:hypothetical protein